MHENHMFMHVLLHSVKTSKIREKHFTKMLKAVGMEVSNSIETRCSMQARAGYDSMQ